MRYFVIAECGINHLGNMKLAKEMIEKSEKVGADAVKFQYYVWEDIQDEFTEAGLIAQVQKSQLSLEQLAELRAYAQSIGIGWICTAFKKARRIAELATLKPDAIKIRYRDFEIRLLEIALKQDVPLVLASCPAPPIENMTLYYHPKARWLYCIPKYPPLPEDYDAAKSTGFHGFSDHFPHITASLLSASLTKSNEYIIEKHVMSPAWEPGPAGGMPVKPATPDLPVSISFKQLKELVDHLRLFEKLRPSKPYFPKPPRTGR